MPSRALETRRNAAQEILGTMRDMHQRNRTVDSAYGVDLGVAESSVLQEVIANPGGLVATDIGARLGLGAVKISRLIKDMLAERLINRVLTDSRLCIVPTDHGREIFEVAYQRACATFSDAYERVPKSRRSGFSEKMIRFCEGLAAPVASTLPSDPPVMTEVRRITRALGWLGRDTFSSGRSAVEWHVLFLVKNLKSKASCATLAGMLATSHATMTTVLNRLSENGWITREAADGDARERKLLLTQEGEGELARIDGVGVARISEGISKFSASDAEDFAEELLFYSGQRIEKAGIVLGNSYHLVRVETSLLSEARAFLVTQRVTQELIHDLPSTLLTESHFNFAIVRDSKIAAVFEFNHPSRSNEVRLIQALVVADREEMKPPSSKIIEDAFQRILEIIKSESALTVIPTILHDDAQVSKSLSLALK